MKGLYFAWVQHSNFHVHQSTRLCTLQRSYWETIWHKYFTPYKYKKFLLDEIRCAGRCDPVRYISLAADVCKINSIVFPNLGSMAHSKVSGCLCGMQKQNWEKAGFSRYTSILRDKTRGEFWITYCSFASDLKTSCDRCYCEPYIHISKRLAGTYTCTYISGLGLYTWLNIWKHSPTSEAKY